MAYLAPATWPDHVDEVSQLGLPLIGRQLALFFSGASFCLGGCYYIVHGGTDSRWLLSLSAAVLALLAVHVILLFESSWQAQMLALTEVNYRWMWEYVAMQPTRATLIGMCQGYLAWRYYALSKTTRIHRNFAYMVALMTAAEWSLYMSIAPLTLYMHFQASSEGSQAYFNGTITRIYCSVCMIACLSDSTLAFGFCRRLWTLRGEDPELDSSLRYICYVALGVGLTTAFTVFTVAMLFLFGKDDSFRLIAELAPPSYAASFYLSLLSRERIRHTMKTKQFRRVQAVEVRLGDASDLGSNVGPSDEVASSLTPHRSPKSQMSDEDSLSLSQVLRDDESCDEKTISCLQARTVTLTTMSSSASAQPGLSDSADSSPLMGSLQVWVCGGSPNGSSSGTSRSSRGKEVHSL